jgi:hypothetical protein
MIMKTIYYILKPFLPRRLQLIIRQAMVSVKRKKFQNVWPILEKANAKPKHWKGWPENKNFAVILTHDVELQRGHDRCEQLLEIEKNLGFKSSFNFVPERYAVSQKLIEKIKAQGFEVGVHGLYHDGKLYSSKNVFTKRAVLINHYIKQWKAVGFRSPAMQHNLDWIKQLNIEYDCSTFDTDPFEPQPDAVETIFPFLVEGESEKDSYIELPYTLAQDFTLFIMMKEKNIDIWKEKIDWIAQNGGMVLINTHPDYMSFNGSPNYEEYTIEFYKELLKYIKTKYRNEYWHALPKDVASFWKNRVEIKKEVDDLAWFI